jgi:hypothetical protein
VALALSFLSERKTDGKLAADFGNQADAVVRAARERVQHQERPANSFHRVRESLTFSRDKNFEREAILDERELIRDGLRRGMGDFTDSQVRQRHAGAA